MGNNVDIDRLFDIRGKTALVTGASGGIGYMIADGLVRAGAKVWICSRKSAHEPKEALAFNALGAYRQNLRPK